MTKHTPTPWSCKLHGNELRLIGPNGNTLNVGSINRTDDVEFIVLACNAHDDLVAELKLIVAGWEQMPRELTPWERERLTFARKALAKAKG